MGKLRTAAVEFDSEFYTPTQAESWLASHGYSIFKDKVDLPGVVLFNRKGMSPIAGSKKSLGKGITALLGKAMKDKEDKEEDDEEEKEEPINGEETKSEDDDADADVEADESETPEEEEVADDEATETEAGEPDEVTEPDEEALRAEAKDLADMIGHFELHLKAAPEHAGRSTKAKELYDEIAANAEEMLTKMKACFGDNFTDYGIEAMSKPAETAPVDATEPVEKSEEMDGSYNDEEVKKAFLRIDTKVTKSAKPLDRIVKSLPRKVTKTA